MNYDVIIRRNTVDPELGYVVELVNEDDVDDVWDSVSIYNVQHSLSPRKSGKGWVFATSLDAARSLTANQAYAMLEKHNV